MKPKTAATHMIISGASLPCWPDPLCVCCENNRHCGCFVPPIRRNLEPHRSEGSGQSSQCTNPKLHTHACTWSSAMPGFYTYMYTLTEYTVTLRAVKIHDSMNSSTSLSLCTVSVFSADPSLCPLSTPSPPSFVPSSFHLPHLHPFCPFLLYLLYSAHPLVPAECT